MLVRLTIKAAEQNESCATSQWMDESEGDILDTCPRPGMTVFIEVSVAVRLAERASHPPARTKTWRYFFCLSPKVRLCGSSDARPLLATRKVRFYMAVSWSRHKGCRVKLRGNEAGVPSQRQQLMNPRQRNARLAGEYYYDYDYEAVHSDLLKDTASFLLTLIYYSYSFNEYYNVSQSYY